MTHSRNKGKRGELELAEALRAEGFEARRGQQFKGGVDSPDVVCPDLESFHIEVKRVEAGNLYGWLKQSIRDAGPGKTPTVFHRKNGEEWVVILRMSDFIKQVRGF